MWSGAESTNGEKWADLETGDKNLQDVQDVRCSHGFWTVEMDGGAIPKKNITFWGKHYEFRFGHVDFEVLDTQRICEVGISSKDK